MAQLWIVGIILIIFGSLGNNLGNNLVSMDHQIKQKQKNAQVSDEESLRQEKEKEKDKEKTLGLPELDKVPEVLKSWRILGVIIIVVGNLATFAAFGFAAQSLLASLESVQFPSNVLFAKFVLKEVVTLRMILSTICIVAGNVLVVIFSDHAATLYTSSMLIDLYRTNSAYHAYLILAFVMFVSMRYTYHKYRQSREVRKVLLWKHSFVEPFAYATSSAIIGTQAVLLSKCMSMLIQVSARGNNQFDQATIWVILVAWIMLVAYWLRALDTSLERFPPLFIIPVMQVFFVLFAILCGGIYFKEFESFGVKQFCGFIIGVLMILGGVYGLAPVESSLPVVPEPQDQGVGCDPGNEDPAVVAPLLDGSGVSVSSGLRKSSIPSVSASAVSSGTTTLKGEEDELRHESGGIRGVGGDMEMTMLVPSTAPVSAATSTHTVLSLSSKPGPSLSLPLSLPLSLETAPRVSDKIGIATETETEVEATAIDSQSKGREE